MREDVAPSLKQVQLCARDVGDRKQEVAKEFGGIVQMEDIGRAVAE